MVFFIATYYHFIATLMPQITILLPQNYENYIFFSENMKKEGKSLHSDSFFCIFATSKKSSCRFHLEAQDSCETTTQT